MDCKVAVIGCGYWGKNLVRNFHELGVLAAVVDNNYSAAEKFAKLYNVPACTFEQVLANEHINSVVIALPAAMHYEYAKKALLNNKHVYVEKPIALELNHANELQALSTSKNKVLMVGHILQYHNAFLQLKSMCEEGELGRLQYIYSNRLNLGKFRREENILWSFAPHDLSMILALAKGLPDTVLATGANYLHDEIADVTTTHMQFSSGLKAHIYVSWLHPYKEQKLVVIGSNKMAVFDDSLPWEQKLAIYPHSISWENNFPVPNKADASYVELKAGEPLKTECLHFINCVNSNIQPITDANEGINVLSVLAAADNSIKQGRMVKLGSPNKTKYFAHSTACIDNPSSIGDGSKIWHFSHILAGCKIGDNCVIGQNVMIGPDVSIGNNCKIQNNVSLYKGIMLEDNVFCGPSAVFTNVYTPRANIERKDEFLPTLLKEGATIGANATIICGVTLGEYCLIGAGAVVTKDVKPHALITGVPGRQTGWVSHAGEVLGDDLICPRTGKQYKFANGELLLQAA